MTWITRIAYPLILKYVKSLLAKKAAQLAIVKIKTIIKKGRTK